MACLNCPAIAGPLQLVSVLDPSQAPPAGGSGDSWAPIISLDGRYVLFASAANNLVLTSNTNAIPALAPPRLNVFLRDRTNGTTTLVSVNLSGTGGGNGDSWPSALSTNGQYALFESSATDLVPSDTNNLTDVFVRDLVNGTTLLVSISTNSGSANGASRSSVMTPDGHYVAFVSEANNLVPGDGNGIPDVFVRDLQARVTTLASVGAKSTTPPSSSGIFVSSSESPDITADGGYVAFYSTATNLVAGVQTVGDIYVRDLEGGSTIWASSYARTAVQSVMGTANAVAFNHAVSDDGQYVVYEARPIPVSTYAPSGLILRYSLRTGLTDLVNTNANVPTAAYEDTHSLALTPDGGPHCVHCQYERHFGDDHLRRSLGCADGCHYPGERRPQQQRASRLNVRLADHQSEWALRGLSEQRGQSGYQLPRRGLSPLRPGPAGSRHGAGGCGYQRRRLADQPRNRPLPEYRWPLRRIRVSGQQSGAQ